MDEIGSVLGRLNGENVGRASYVRTPEYEKALEVWKEKEREWENFLETLPVEQREKAEEIKGCQEDFDRIKILSRKNKRRRDQ